MSRFFNKKSIIGMIHFPPLIGYDNYPGIEYIKEKALKDLKSLEEGGVDGIIIENNYDVPHKKLVSEDIKTQMLELSKIIRASTNLPLGICVLWNDYRAALDISNEVGLNFIRVPVFVDSVLTAYGEISANPRDVTSYRKHLNAENVEIWTDVQVKHAKMIKDRTIKESVIDAIKNNSDGIIITGRWTADAPLIGDLKDAKESSGGVSIICGSGTTPYNINEIMKYADIAIVGTYFKTGENLDKNKEVNIRKFEEGIDTNKVRELIKAIK